MWVWCFVAFESSFWWVCLKISDGLWLRRRYESYFFPESLQCGHSSCKHVCLYVSACVCNCALVCEESRHFIDEFPIISASTVTCIWSCRADWTSLFQPGSSSFSVINTFVSRSYKYACFFIFYFIKPSITQLTSCQIICEKGTSVPGTRLDKKLFKAGVFFQSHHQLKKAEVFLSLCLVTLEHFTNWAVMAGVISSH